MNRLILATTLMVATGSVTALAQTRMPQDSVTNPGASTSTTLPQAPIGHRQPRRSDIPQTAQPDSTITAQDKELDRKIRNICRGC